MQNWVIHFSRTRQLNIFGSIYGGKLLAVNQNMSGGIYGSSLLVVNQNMSGGIYGGSLLAVNQNNDHIFSGKQVLLTSTATALWWSSDSERNKLSTNFHKFIGNIFSGVDICPKNGK